MNVIWTPRATFDLDDLTDYIGAKSPDAAVRIAAKIIYRFVSWQVRRILEELAMFLRRESGYFIRGRT